MLMEEPHFTSLEGGQISLANGTIWFYSGECERCGAETNVMEADPEQAGYGFPLCQDCIDETFELLQRKRAESEPPV